MAQPATPVTVSDQQAALAQLADATQRVEELERLTEAAFTEYFAPAEPLELVWYGNGYAWMRPEHVA